MIIIFLLIVIDIPVKRSENGIKRDITPTDWKNISAIKLPLKPRKFFISWFFGNIKLGSSGE